MQRLVASFLFLALVGCSSPPPEPPPPPAAPLSPGVSERIHPAWNAALSGLFRSQPRDLDRKGHTLRWDDSDELRRAFLAQPRSDSGRRPSDTCGSPALRPATKPTRPWPLAPILPWGDPMSPSGNVVALHLELEPAWVLIDVGSTHNVKVGHIFEIRRRGVPLARLVLDEVVAGQSAGRILHARDAQRIRLGDQVYFVGVEVSPEERLDWNGWPELQVPSIDASVLATKDDVGPQLVLLDVGEEDKVEPGFHFSVYRKSQFVGKVVVERVLQDSAGCRVLFTAEGLEVQPGDKAATRLQ
jgi:hypothetical protein